MTVNMLASNLFMLMPLYLVWLAGIVVAIRNWRKNPSISLLTTVAIVIMWLLAITSRVVSFWLFRQQAINDLPTSTIDTVTTIMNIVLPFLNAGCWCLLLAAIFGWRKKD
jgi:hypothetical protein